MDARARFDALCDDLLARNGDLERAQMMGYPSLKRNGKLVACFSPGDGAMVFKLADTAARERALALEGAHLFDPGGRGRAMREWVAVPPALADRWPELAEAVLAQMGKAIVVGPGEGTAIGFGPVIKAPSELSHDAFTVVEGRLSPGASGPPMHRHRSHDESFYVIEGTLTVVTPHGEDELGVGAYAFLRRGTAHTVTNRTDGQVRYLSIAGGGLDRFIAELYAAEDDTARRSVLDRYDTELVT